MKFCRLMGYDVRNGILRKGYFYLIVLLMSGILFAGFQHKLLQGQESISNVKEEATLMNVLFYLFAGKAPFNPEVESAFLIPVVWLVIFLYPAFITLDYPFRNLTGQGIQVMIRSEERRYWWLSKCIWAFLGTISYFFVLYLSMTFFCMISGMEVSLSYAPDINQRLLEMQVEDLSENQVFCLVFILPVMTSLAVNFLQLCMGLFWDRMYCYLLSVIILFSSAYFLSPFAIGNFAMLKRSVFCDGAGLTVRQGIMVNTSLIVLSVILGAVRMEKFDILKKNG